MKKYLIASLIILGSLSTTAQKKSPLFKGMYVQWGYNTEAYTRSNIHFNMSNGNNFTPHRA